MTTYLIDRHWKDSKHIQPNDNVLYGFLAFAVDVFASYRKNKLTAGSLDIRHNGRTGMFS